MSELETSSDEILNHNQEDFNEGETESFKDCTNEKYASIQKDAIKSVASFLFTLMAVFGACFVVFTLIFQAIMRPITVVGQSMYPTINAYSSSAISDMVYYTPYYNSLNSGDIVIVNSNYSTEGHSIIKRIIACPGDTITFKTYGTYYYKNDDYTILYTKYNIYLNGKILNEVKTDDNPNGIIVEPMELRLFSQVTEEKSDAYYFYNELSNALSDKLTTGGEMAYTLGENKYFIMGDNRNNSIDSRYFGPVDASDILGKVVLKIPANSNLLESIIKTIFG